MTYPGSDKLKIYIIAAALPPALDGIGDYTALLALEIARSHTVTILTGQAQPTPIAGVVVETLFSVSESASVRDLIARIESGPPDWVLLQYNPFSYGRWGCNLHLPGVIAEIKRRCPKTRITVMMHEYFAEPVDNWRFAIMNTWQRWQFWSLGQSADLLFFSMEASAHRFQRWFPRTPCRHLPVGSNLPHVSLKRSEARARLGIETQTLVFGLFGSAHISRLLNWARLAAEAVAANGHDVCVLYVGPDQHKVCQALGSVPLIADGAAAPEEASRRLAAMDIYLLPFADGVSTRRGTLMAGLQHGLAILGTRGCHTEGILGDHHDKALLLAEMQSSEAFAATALRLTDNVLLRERLGQNARLLYDAHFSWPRIAERQLQAMADCAERS